MGHADQRRCVVCHVSGHPGAGGPAIVDDHHQRAVATQGASGIEDRVGQRQDDQCGKEQAHRQQPPGGPMGCLFMLWQPEQEPDGGKCDARRGRRRVGVFTRSHVCGARAPMLRCIGDLLLSPAKRRSAAEDFVTGAPRAAGAPRSPRAPRRSTSGASSVRRLHRISSHAACRTADHDHIAGQKLDFTFRR